MEGTTTSEFLLVVLRSRVALVFSPSEPGDILNIAGDEYHQTSKDDAPGFYDWLRNTAGDMLGVRFTPLEDVTRLIEAIRELTYVVVPADGLCIEIYFSEAREVDEQRSDDQAFGGNKIYMTHTGKFILTFETHFLSDAEMRSLRTADAEWVSLVD